MIENKSTPRFDINVARQNDRIGTRLVSKNDDMSIWHIDLAPGETLPAHRHDRPYFWTILTAGKGRSHYGDGRVVEVEYAAGDTQHHAEAHFVHDLTNIGDTHLLFVTVEFNSN